MRMRRFCYSILNGKLDCLVLTTRFAQTTATMTEIEFPDAQPWCFRYYGRNCVFFLFVISRWFGLYVLCGWQSAKNSTIHSSRLHSILPKKCGGKCDSKVVWEKLLRIGRPKKICEGNPLCMTSRVVGCGAGPLVTPPLAEAGRSYGLRYYSFSVQLTFSIHVATYSPVTSLRWQFLKIKCLCVVCLT